MEFSLQPYGVRAMLKEGRKERHKHLSGVADGDWRVNRSCSWSVRSSLLLEFSLSADAARTVLRVDQILMAKPSGGPRREQPTGMDDD